MNGTMKIGSASAKQGEMGKGFIKVGELAVHSEILIPVLIVHGWKPGPVLWINGAVHGDELNGFMAARLVAHETNPKELRGTLVCTPLCNPLAVQWRQKQNPFDQLDLDQQFPGSPEGLISQQTADSLFREIKEKADCVINFHTAGSYFYAPPYTVFKKVGGTGEKIYERTRELAGAFGLEVNCLVDLTSGPKGELPGNISGALDVACACEGIPAFMAEIGSGGKFEENNIAIAVRGIRNIMRQLDMVEGPVERPAEQILITKRRFLYCRRAGFYTAEARPGQILAKKGTIGRIIDLFSEIETISVAQKTYVIQVRVNPVVHSGDRVAFLGLEWGIF